MVFNMKMPLLWKTFIFIVFGVIVVNIWWVFKFQKHTPITVFYNFSLKQPNRSEQSLHEMLQIENQENFRRMDIQFHHTASEITIAAVACDDRASETLVMMKSAVMSNPKERIRFILFVDDSVSKIIRESIESWPAYILSQMKIELHPIQLPNSGKANEWKKLFKPCASQRLFFPSLLKDVDSLLYMDTDTLFLTSPLNVWEHFHRMNSSQMAALAPEHEDYATGWYNRFARHPYYGSLGVNSGVMLMNLTRMRQFNWEKYVIPIYQEYKSKITWGDQDIINIVFHFHPEKLYIYPCNFNFRPDHCMYMSVCKSAEEEGVHVIHGNRGSFHNEKQPSFRSIYKAINEYQFGDDLWSDLLIPMKDQLSKTKETNCGKVHHFITKAFEEHLQTLKEKSQ